MIRQAILDDLDRLVEMGCDFLSSSPYGSRVAYSSAHMRDVASRLIHSDEGAVFVLESVSAGALVGMIMVFVSAHPLSGETFAHELCWWVDPGYRGSAGVRLLVKAESWARSKGARALHMVAPSPGVECLYTRLGYSELETTYTKELVA